MMLSLVATLIVSQVTVYEEGTRLSGRATEVNCSGLGVSCSMSGLRWTLSVDGGTVPLCSYNQYLWADGGTYGCANFPTCAAKQVLANFLGTGPTCSSSFAGGNPTEVQYNNAGALGGVSNFTSDGVVATLGNDAGTVTNPADGLKLYGRRFTSCAEFFAMAPVGQEFPLQPALWAFPSFIWSPSGASNMAAWGSGSAGVVTTNGTITTPVPTIGDDVTWRYRTRLATAAGANATAYGTCTGNASGVGIFYVGDISGRGGYAMTARVSATPAVTAQARYFVGVRNSVATIFPSSDPSSFAPLAAFIVDSTDTTWRFATARGDGGTTETDLGSDFVVRDAGTPYTFRVCQESNSTTVTYHATNEWTGVVKFGEHTDNVPPADYFLCPLVGTSNGSTAAINYLEFYGAYGRGLNQ